MEIAVIHIAVGCIKIIVSVLLITIALWAGLKDFKKKYDSEKNISSILSKNFC